MLPPFAGLGYGCGAVGIGRGKARAADGIGPMAKGIEGWHADRLADTLGYSNRGVGRRVSGRRAGARDSTRGAAASSSSFKFGRIVRCKVSHCAIDTTTAISTPLRVTIWGPSARVFPSSSLNRALAVWTCHRLLIGFSLPYQTRLHSRLV